MSIRILPRRWGIATIVLVVLVLVSELSWIALDTRLQPVVDEWVEKSLNLADGLATTKMSDVWRHIYWASLGPRAPVYPLLAVGPLWLFGRSVDSILLVNCASLILLAYATFKLAARILDSRAGFLATAFVMLYPVTTSLAKLARPHALIASTVALALLAMYMLAFEKPSHRNIWFVAASLLLVFGAHAGGLNLLIVPFVVAAWLFTQRIAAQKAEASDNTSGSWINPVKRVLTSKLVLYSALPAFALLFGLIGAWMILKWGQYQAMMDVAERIFRPMVSEWFYEASFASALGRPSFHFFLIALCGLLSLRGALSSQTKRGCDFLLLSLAGAFALSHLASGGKSWHHMSGAVPMVAVVTGVGLVASLGYLFDRFKLKEGSRHWMAPLTFLMTLLAALPYFAVNWASTALASAAVQITGVKAPCERLSDNGACHHPPMDGDWHVRELMAVLVKDSKCKVVPCDVAVLGHRQDYFSDESLTYSLVKEYSSESRLASGLFYPERNIRFKRVNGSEQNAEYQLSESDYVLIVLGNNDQNPEYRNHFFDREKELSVEIIERNRVDYSKIVLEKLLPTGERMLLVALHKD